MREGIEQGGSMFIQIIRQVLVRFWLPLMCEHRSCGEARKEDRSCHVSCVKSAKVGGGEGKED